MELVPAVPYAVVGARLQIECRLLGGHPAPDVDWSLPRESSATVRKLFDAGGRQRAALLTFDAFRLSDQGARPGRPSGPLSPHCHAARAFCL